MFWLRLALFLIPSIAAADQGPEGTIRDTLSWRPPNAVLSLEFLTAKEFIFLEKDCRDLTNQGYDASAFAAGPSLEFGFHLELPQNMPAQAIWFSRFHCRRPGVLP